MNEMFPKWDRQVMVAVAFDDRLETVVHSASELCRRSGAGLRLVHVCDPWTKSLLAAQVDDGAGELVQVVKAETARVAARRLAALRGRLPPDLEVRTQVLAGEVVPSLAVAAQEGGAGIVVVGASARGHFRYILRIIDRRQRHHRIGGAGDGTERWGTARAGPRGLDAAGR